MTLQWISHPLRPNQLLQISKTCYVSFNPSPASISLRGFFTKHDSGPQTALVIDEKFYILNGDFRDEYLAAAQQDPASVLDVYQRHREQHRALCSDSEPGEPSIGQLVASRLGSLPEAQLREALLDLATDTCKMLEMLARTVEYRTVYDADADAAQGDSPGQPDVES